MRDLDTVLNVCAANLELQNKANYCARLFHGRGHTFPGLEFLSVDWYPPIIIISVFGDHASQAWIANLANGLQALIPELSAVAVQYRGGRKTVCVDLIGEVPESHLICEADLSFGIRPKQNQNIGFFLDMAPARAWVKANARSCSVLNLFAFTCSFSIFAYAGGASKIVNNDMAKTMLEYGRENHRLNEHNLDRVKFIPHNLFKSWGRVKQFGRYDLIIIDPPTNQRGSFVAEKDYGTVLKRIPQIANPGAKILACLNSPFLPRRFLSEQMMRRAPACKFVEDLPVASSFPEQFPDQGLKLSVFTYQP